MHHAEAHELGLLEPGDQPEDARLLAPLDLRLEADEAEVIAGESVLTQLHDRVRLAPAARIDEADRLHRSEPQRVAAAVRHDLDRQAPLEEPFFVEIVDRRRLGGDERVVEALVLFARQRAIQIVALAIVHAARWSSWFDKLTTSEFLVIVRPELFDAPLILSLSKDERLPQGRLLRRAQTSSPPRRAKHF